MKNVSKILWFLQIIENYEIHTEQPFKNDPNKQFKTKLLNDNIEFIVHKIKPLTRHL